MISVERFQLSDFLNHLPRSRDNNKFFEERLPSIDIFSDLDAGLNG
jgi:hypothetical protein